MLRSRFASAALARSVSSLRPSPVAGSLSHRAVVSRQDFCWASIACRSAGSVATALSSSVSSTAARSVVWRMVRAWKKDQRFAASTLREMASVCALFAPVSASARKRARMAISSAMRLSPLWSTWACPAMDVL